MKKSFVYEYENTPKRRVLDGLENFVNWSLFITATVIIFGGLTIAIINLI